MAHPASRPKGSITAGIPVPASPMGRVKLVGAVMLVAGVAAAAIGLAISPTFTARAVILPPQQQQNSTAAALQSLGALAGLGGGGLRSPADQYVALMQSTTLEDRLVQQFGLQQVYEVKFKSDARKELEGRTRISVGKRDGLIAIEVDDLQPQRAADLANAYIEQLRRLTGELAMTEAQQRRRFFEGQLKDTRTRLQQAQRELQAAGFSEGALRAEPRAAADNFARLRAEVTGAEVNLQSLRATYAETSQEFVQARGRLAALRAQLAKAEAANPAAGGSDYMDRYREFKYQETLNDLFIRQLELAKLDESREGTLIQVVDVATPPERKSKPRLRVIVLGTMLAAGLLALLGIFLLPLLGTGAGRSTSSAGPQASS